MLNNNDGNNNTICCLGLPNFSHDIVYEILTFLPTRNLFKISACSKSFYQFIHVTTENNLWKYLLRNEFKIYYFPFHKYNILNEKVLCKLIDQFNYSFQMIDKNTYVTNSQTNSSFSENYAKLHLKGSLESGKTLYSLQLTSLNQPLQQQDYEPTISFKIRYKTYKEASDLENNYSVLKLSVFDHSGKKEKFPIQSIFSPNLFSGKTLVYYLFKDENSLMEIKEWKKEIDNQQRKGIRVQSNALIGSKINVEQEIQLAPLECIIYNNQLLTTNDEELLIKAIELAKELEMPLIIVNALKNMNVNQSVCIGLSILNQLYKHAKRN
ncbi:hypothetical protein ABK040_007868 [Willaertia magna]